MNTIQAGFQGATPELAVKPVDPSLPTCDRPVVLVLDGFQTRAARDGEPGPTMLSWTVGCTRKQGHYGPCGVAK